MYYVYIRKGQTRSYIGSTKDVTKRLKEHSSKKTKSLKNQRPFKIVYLEKAASKTEAIRREHHIKSFKGGNAFKKLINTASPSSSLA